MITEMETARLIDVFLFYDGGFDDYCLIRGQWCRIDQVGYSISRDAFEAYPYRGDGTPITDLPIDTLVLINKDNAQYINACALYPQALIDRLCKRGTG